MTHLEQKIIQIHNEGYKICLNTFGKYFDNSGNIGIFCQSEDEYQQLFSTSRHLVQESSEDNRKYFVLKEPIKLLIHENNKEVVYTHLYIRKFDPTDYGKHIGDIDFYVSENEYIKILKRVQSNEFSNAEVYNQEGVGQLIELKESSTSALAYISRKEITEKIRFRY